MGTAATMPMLPTRVRTTSVASRSDEMRMPSGSPCPARIISNGNDADWCLIDENLSVSAGPSLPAAILSPTAAVHPGTGRAIVQGDEGGFVLVPDDLCLP